MLYMYFTFDRVVGLLHCNGNSVYIFLFWELRGLSPNFHIHVSVSNFYIPRIGPHISSSRKGRPIVGIYNSLTYTWMWKLGLRPRAPIFLFWEYLFQIFGILSLQCIKSRFSFLISFINTPPPPPNSSSAYYSQCDPDNFPRTFLNADENYVGDGVHLKCDLKKVADAPFYQFGSNDRLPHQMVGQYYSIQY